jgi:Cdc6-like AAA superfamily ATPase
VTLDPIQNELAGAVGVLPGEPAIMGLLGITALIALREVHRKILRPRRSASTSESVDHKTVEGDGGLQNSDSKQGGEREQNVDGNTSVESESAATEDTGNAVPQSDEQSRSFTDYMLFWRREREENREDSDRSGLSDDPRVDREGLAFTAEFDDILDTETRQAITTPDKEVEGVRDLPPDFDVGDDPEDFFYRVERLHQRQIAPDRVKKGSTHYNLGKKYRRVLYAHKVPSVTPLAGHKEIIEDPSLHFAMTIHFHALDQQKTLRGVENLKRNLDAAVSTEASSDELAAGDKARRKQRVCELRDEMKQNNQRAFEMTFYVSVADEDEERLLERVDEVRREFRTNPGIHLKTVERKQKKALRSASPLGIDPLYDDDNEIDPGIVGLGRSFGAIMASLSESSKFEPSGHEWGVHSVQGHPIVKDPFDSPRNYNVTIVGESGTGKSVNAKRMALETKAVYPNALIIMLDPLQGFLGLAEALDAKKVTIGGGQPINPMEIRKPPQEYINSEAFDEEKDPLSAKVDDVMAFLQNYVGQQPGLELGNESQLLRSLILAAYRAQGITHDVETHDRPSPTLAEVSKLAEDAKKNPDAWATGPEDTTTIKEHASQIGTILREFTEGGQYENLATRPEEDIFGDNDVIYLDLHQQEASGGSGTGMTGQLLFSSAYELCKQHPGPAVYLIDEARYLFRNADTLDYLAQRVRHSRHYDTSIRFITQEMDDFFEFDQAEGIVNNSSFQIIHQSPQVDRWGDKFGLKEHHKEFVKSAATGKNVDYSQALVRFPETDQWYPLTIDLGDRMLSIADFDEKKDRYEDLPGNGTDNEPLSPVERELIARVRNGAKSHDTELESILEEWEEPIWEMLTTERAERCLERIANGDHPRKAVYVEALDQVRWLISVAGGEQVAPEVADRLIETIKDHYDETYNVSNDVEKLKERIENGTLEMQGRSNPTANESSPNQLTSATGGDD